MDRKEIFSNQKSKLDTFFFEDFNKAIYIYYCFKHEVFVLSHTPKISSTVSRVLSSLSNQVKKTKFFFKRTTTVIKDNEKREHTLNVCYFLP